MSDFDLFWGFLAPLLTGHSLAGMGSQDSQLVYESPNRLFETGNEVGSNDEDKHTSLDRNGLTMSSIVCACTTPLNLVV